MPQVKIEVENFDHWPPRHHVPPGSGHGYVTAVEVSGKDLDCASAEVGASSAVFGSPHRTRLEVGWRIGMTRANIAPTPRSVTPSRWMKTRAYQRLDPSEKSAISYHIGMVLPGVIASKCWNVPHLVHVDAVLQLRGISLGNVKRPDLVGYRLGANARSLGRIIIEAKGRSNEYAQAPVNSALNQLSAAPPQVQRLVGSMAPKIASLAYFDDELSLYLIDPAEPWEESDISDAEFRALIDVAYWWPFFEMIALDDAGGDFSLDRNWARRSFEDDFLSISIPLHVYETLSEIGSYDPVLLERFWRGLEDVNGSQGPLSRGEPEKVRVEFSGNQ